MVGSTRILGARKGLLQRRAALIVGVTVLSVAAVLTAVRLVADDRASLNYPLVIGVGLIEGLVLGVVVAYVWDRLAGRLRHTSDIEAATGLKVLGVVPAMRLEGGDRVAVNASRPVAGTQAYGIVAAELANILRESGPICLLVTSPSRGDGRTTTAINLSTLLAAEGLQVALLSADPDGEGVDEVLDLERRPGLTEVLAGSRSLDSALQPGGVERLRVLTAGRPSDEMLGRSLDKLALLLDRLTRDFDLVVIDAPPVLGGLEAMLIAQDVDLVLLVVDVRHGKRSEAATAVAYLEHVQDRLVGCVANDPEPRRFRRRARTPLAAEPDISPATAATTGLAAVAAAAGLRLRRGGRAVGGAVGSAAGSTRVAAGKVTSAASVRALRRHPWAGALVSALAVAIVISTVWWVSYDDSTEAKSGPPAPDRSLAVTASSGPAAVAAAMEVCRSTWDAQEEPLEAAAKSLEQWQLHISAMNQLVAGEITLDQANAFWEQTRRQAAHKVHHFESVDGTYQTGDHSCPPPDVAPNGDPDLAALTACQQSVAQRDDTLGAARVAIGTWHHHVMDMNMMQAGTLSAARAVQLWNKYWHQGAAELHSYHKQLRQTDGQPC